MKKTYFMAFAVALVLSACGSNNANKPGTGDVENDSTEVIVENAPSIVGQWQIDNIVLSDSENIRPEEKESEETPSFNFLEDGTVSITTNCNTVNGAYTVNGDSIAFTKLMSTRMACPDMSIEESVQKILPEVKTLDWTSDSIVRLNTATPSQYIVLKQMK